jgi:hypothetical protein
VRPHSALADRSPEEFARDWKRIERGLAAHGSAGKPNAGRRGALQRYRGSEALAAFRPTLIREGRARKAVQGQREIASDKERVARGCQLSLLSAINAGNTGTNRPHLGEISTAGRYTFAGRVSPGRHYPIGGILRWGKANPARFRSAGAIASYVGVAPRLRQFGKKRLSGSPTIPFEIRSLAQGALDGAVARSESDLQRPPTDAPQPPRYPRWSV